MTTETTPYELEKRTVEQLREARNRIGAELAKAVVGQKEVVEQLLLALEAAPGFRPAQKLLLEMSR